MTTALHICSQPCHIKDFFYTLFSHNSLANSFALLALKQRVRVLGLFFKYIGETAIGFKKASIFLIISALAYCSRQLALFYLVLKIL